MKYKRFAALVVSFAMLFGLQTSLVSANSARTSWSGVDSTGSYVTDEDCPVTVEQELLTFDLTEFPVNHYQDESSFLDYSGKVTAQYTFYNPADYTVTARLAFPFGGFPDYGFENYDETMDTLVYADDTQKYAITVDGKEIDKQLRHTLFASYEQFDPERDPARLQDGFAEDPFYSPALTVTCYTFTLSGIDEETWPAANAAIDLPAFDGKTRYLLIEQSGGSSLSDGCCRASVWAENGMDIHLYVIGENSTPLPEWQFYQDGGTEDGEEIDGTVTLTETETMTFQDLALIEYNPSGTVSESDWYNAIVALFNEYSDDNFSFIQLAEMTTNYMLNISSQLMRWYVYELTLEPGQTLVNTVEAPMYPSINLRDDPAVYGYTYLLSPAQTWAEFGDLEIVINTPYYLTASTLEGFEKTETGYSLSLDGLPEGDLIFSLSTEQPPVIKAGFIIAATVILMIAVGLAVLIHRGKKMKNTPEETI